MKAIFYYDEKQNYYMLKPAAFETFRSNNLAFVNAPGAEDAILQLQSVGEKSGMGTPAVRARLQRILAPEAAIAQR